MNINRHIRFGAAILFAFLAMVSTRAAEAPALAKADSAPSAQKSAFISAFMDSKTFGRDPFFPKSKRRELPLTVNIQTNLPPGELPAGMVLKGLSGTKDKPLAIINNYTFATGEESEVRVGHQLFRVKVVEIKERSVMLQVNGQQAVELTFRRGL
jgi:hypothetical protein